jgi:hypothetical protein
LYSFKKNVLKEEKSRINKFRVEINPFIGPFDYATVSLTLKTIQLSQFALLSFFKTCNDRETSLLKKDTIDASHTKR